MRGHTAIFELRTRVDEQMVSELGAEGITAVARSSSELRTRFQQRLMAVDFGVVRSGKHARAAGMVRVIVRVDDCQDGTYEAIPEGVHDRLCVDGVCRRVDDNGAFLSLYQRDIARRIPHGSKDTVRDFDDFLPEFCGTRTQLLAPGEFIWRRGRRLPEC
ncbi:hypothetical protein D9M70_575270 [compost metagenome]